MFFIILNRTNARQGQRIGMHSLPTHNLVSVCILKSTIMLLSPGQISGRNDAQNVHRMQYCFLFCSAGVNANLAAHPVITRQFVET